MNATHSTPQIQCTVFAFPPDTLSAEECYRINGTLTPGHIEGLLDSAEAADVLELVDAHLIDADQFPEEDFAADILADLSTIADGMRKGERLDALNAAIAALEELQLTIGRATEYGRDELSKARELIECVTS